MQRWSREAGSWVDDMGVLRIDVDAHANRSLAALARSLLFVIPAKAGTRRLRFFKVSKSLGPRFRGDDGTFYCRPSAASTIPCAPARKIGRPTCRERVGQYVKV